MKQLEIKGYKEKLSLSKIVLGSVGFGSRQNQAQAFELLDTYYELGGRTIDTAKVYGSWASDTFKPLSEMIIGEWLKSRQYKDISIITKGCHPVITSMDKPRVGRSFIIEDIESSLEALKRDTIQVWDLHRDNVQVEIGEIVETVNEMLSKGYIQSAGISNWSLARIKEAKAYAVAHGLEPFTNSQVNWSLAHANDWAEEGMHALNNEEYHWYKEHQLPVLAWGSLAGGIVMKTLKNAAGSVSESVRNQYDNEITRHRINEVDIICKETGLTPTQICIAYLTCNPLAAAALVGPGSITQLNDIMQAADTRIEKEVIEQLSE